MAQRHEVAANEVDSDQVEHSRSRQKILERRLEDGYRRIDQAALAGTDVADWESFWIKLLGEYEDVCRESDLAA